ncbi:fimbrillin family protein [Bacteroides nordii]|uniref:fimbrillin family protein n=1 Tax=Bacteroides nordii TaxID=291645 RepID=UPI0018A8E2C3|nr:fimbrillin family protein [Bacteroides nordii]
MKPIRIYLRLQAATLLVTILTGCSSDENPAMTSGEVVPVQISASLEATVQSRAATPVALPTGSEIGVFRVADVNYADAAINVKYTLQKGGWKAENPIFVAEADAKLYACYPYGKATLEADDPALAVLQNAACTQQTDWCYAPVSVTQKVNNMSPAINLDFVKPYSQLSLVIYRGSRYPMDCKVTQIKIALSNGGAITDSQSINLTDGIVGAVKTVQTLYTYPTSGKMHDTGMQVGEAHRDSTCNYLFVPQVLPVGAGLELTFTVDGSDYSVIIPHADLPELIRGTRHQVAIEIRDGVEIAVQQVTIAVWQKLDALPVGVHTLPNEAGIEGGSTEDWNENQEPDSYV